MSTGTSPDIDWYYKTYQEELGPWLIKSFIVIIEGAILSEEALRALTIVIT